MVRKKTVRKFSPEQREKMKANMEKARAARQSKVVEEKIEEAHDAEVQNAGNEAFEEKAEIPEAPAQPQTNVPQVSFSPEQFDRLLEVLGNGQSSKAPANLAAVGQQQTNAQGQVVGSITKFPVDPAYYPNPIEELTNWFDTDSRTRRFAFSENYYLTFEITSKPYDTKYGTSIREPTFHVTLFSTLYDEEGLDTGKFIVIQTLELNEDESTALELAAEFGYETNSDSMREMMNKARFERIKRWLLNIFFPEHNFDFNQFGTEEAIDGTVVKVVTKSNVKGFGNKTPKIEVEELQ